MDERLTEIPDWEGNEVDEHPAEVGDTTRCDDDQHGRNTKNDGKKDERQGGLCRAGNDGDHDEVAEGSRNQVSRMFTATVLVRLTE